MNRATGESHTASDEQATKCDRQEERGVADAVVSSLPKLPSPYTSLAHSPDYRFAVVVGKNGKLQVVSITAEMGLTELRSFRVLQHFRGLDSSLHSAAVIGGSIGAPLGPATQQQPPVSTGSSKNNNYYGDIRGLFMPPPSATISAATSTDHTPTSPSTITAVAAGPAGGGGGAANVNLTDVAWSASFSNICSKSNFDNRDLFVDIEGDGRQINQRKGKDVASVGLSMSPNLVKGSLFDRQKQASSASGTMIDSDSLVAAAGSNGVVVIWHAQTALLGLSTLDRNQTGSDRAGNNGACNHHSNPMQNITSFFGLGGGGVGHGLLRSSEVACRASASADAAATEAFGQPEAILAEHSRAVNRVSFHPRKPFLLLTASQDGSVKLWERRGASRSISGTSNGQRDISDEPVSAKNASANRTGLHHSKNSGGSGVLLSWFGVNQSPLLQPAGQMENIPNISRNISSQYTNGSESKQDNKTNFPFRPPTWHCLATFQSNRSDAIRDVQWSPHLDNIFAMTTDSGYLILYDSRVVARPYFKVAAHSGECTSVDWHPTRPYTLATSGGRDRTVKIWDVEQGLSLGSDKIEESVNGGRHIGLLDNVNTDIGSGSGSFGKNHASHKVTQVAPKKRGQGQAQVTKAQHIKINAVSRDSAGSLSDDPLDRESADCVASDLEDDSPRIEPMTADFQPSSYGSMGNQSAPQQHFTIGSGLPSSLQKPNTILRRNLSEVGSGLQQKPVASSNTSRSATYGRLGTQGSRERLGKPSMAVNIHTLSIGSPVTKVHWRPSSLPNAVGQHLNFGADDDSGELHARAHLNLHDSMLAVSTAPISGTNAFEKGSISLWTVHRPFLPLSVVQGHEEGAVADFFLLGTPVPELRNDYNQKNQKPEGNETHSIETDCDAHPKATGIGMGLLNRTRKDEERSEDVRHVNWNDPVNEGQGRQLKQQSKKSGASRRASFHLETNLRQGADQRRPERRYGSNLDISSQNNALDEVKRGVSSATVGIWQHVVSVGRDGGCLLQSLARGNRPIELVPSCALAIAPLTPFSKQATGSLQLVSVHQNVPAGQENDFLLTGLRQDIVTARAPGVFRELPQKSTTLARQRNPAVDAKKRSAVPPRSLGSFTNCSMLPVLNFTSIDNRADDRQHPITIAPELEHFSRFAKTYKLHLDKICTTRSSVCSFNANIASEVKYESHAQMWKIIASVLKGSRFDDPHNETSKELTESSLVISNVSLLDFVLWPTLKNLLSERANLGDIQTCVVLCEIMGAIVPPSSSSTDNSDVTSLIPGLEVQQIREWYFSYIEILHQHALFQVATELISTCRDPLIGAMNKNSTTFYESCPFCGKPLQGLTTHQDSEDESKEASGGRPVLAAQRACGNCRNKVGLCFLCQTPVQELFVWCAGCGHGGHLEHALDWFCDSAQEYCPTGCGHKCNLTRMGPFPTTSAFPIWQPPEDFD